MTVKLSIPAALRGFTDGKAQVELEGATLGDLLDGLVGLHPDIGPHLLDENGAPRGYVNFFVDGKNVKGGLGLGTPVGPGRSVALVPAIAGGSRGDG